MITREEWDKLKESERYGLYAKLYTIIELHEHRIHSLELKTKNY